MMFNYKTISGSSNSSLPSLLSSVSGSSHHLHNPLSIITQSSSSSIHNTVGGIPSHQQQHICLECALTFLFDKSQLSLRKIKLLDMMKQLLSPSQSSLAFGNLMVNLDHVGSLLLSTCLKAILPIDYVMENSLVKKSSWQQTSVESNILEEVIRMWLDIVPADKLLSRDFPLIVQMMSGEQQLGDTCTNFLCLFVDKICRTLQAEDCWNVVNIPVEAFSSLLTILINNFTSVQTFNKAENEQKSDLLFIILKLCQLVQLHNDCSSIAKGVWGKKPIESFLDIILACLLRAEDEDLHINALAVLNCLVRFDKDILDVLSILDNQRLIDALISVILSPNISIQIICNQLILECSTKSPDVRLEFLNSDISDFLFEALNKDATGEITLSILAIFHSFLLSGNSLSGTNFLNNFHELGITTLLKIFPSKVETINHLDLSNNILSVFYLYYLNGTEFGPTSNSQKEFQNKFSSLCEQISITMTNFPPDVVKEMVAIIGLSFKTLCEICYLLLQSTDTSKLMDHLTVLFGTILKCGDWDEVEEGLATFVICAIGIGRLNECEQQGTILSRIDELILEHVDLSFSNGLHERLLRTCHDYIYQRLVQQKRSNILHYVAQKKFFSMSINSSSMTLPHKQLIVQVLCCSDLLEKPVEGSILDQVDFSPHGIVGMLRSDLFELGIALLHYTLFNNETITPLNVLLSNISTIILDKSLINLGTLGRLRLSELFVGLSLQYPFSTIPSTIASLVLSWYLECMKLTNFAFKERTSLFVKWASQQESTTSGITRSLISGLIHIQGHESYLLGILKDARVDLVPTLVSLFMDNSTSKNSTSQFLRLMSEYFSTETLIHEKDSALVIQKIIEPTLSNIYISLKKGCNTNLTSTLDEIAKCTGIILDYSRNTPYLSTIFNHYSKIFHSISDLKLDLKTIGLTMNILTKIIFLIRSSDDNGVSLQRLSSFQVKSNLTRSLQSVERLLTLFGSENISSGFIISLFQLITALLRTMGTFEENYQSCETLLKFAVEYLNNDSPLLRILATCTFHTILSISRTIDCSKIWNFGLVYALLNNVLSNEDLLALYSVKSLYLLEIKRSMSESVLAQSMWNEFIVSTIVNDSRTEDCFRPSFIVYMCSIMWTCPPLFYQLFGTYFNRNFFRKLIGSANSSCINEWKALIETLLSHPTISNEDKVFIANHSVECCTKLQETIFESHVLGAGGETSIVSDIFLHPQLLEIGKNKDFSNLLLNMQQLISKQFNICY